MHLSRLEMPTAEDVASGTAGGLFLPANTPQAVLDRWDFHLLERKDLDVASELALECFYEARLALNFEDMDSSSVEYKVWKKIMDSFTSMDKFDTKFGNFLGFYSRSGSRLANPSFERSNESFLLAATEKGKEDSEDVVAMVEICLEKVTGKLAPAIANPFRNKRNLDGDEQLYLCNLCVAKSARRKGLGRLLCELSEELAIQVRLSGIRIRIRIRIRVSVRLVYQYFSVSVFGSSACQPSQALSF